VNKTDLVYNDHEQHALCDRVTVNERWRGQYNVSCNSFCVCF